MWWVAFTVLQVMAPVTVAATIVLNFDFVFIGILFAGLKKQQPPPVPGLGAGFGAHSEHNGCGIWKADGGKWCAHSTNNTPNPFKRIPQKHAKL
jgi:hypothetical protein